MLVCEVHSLDLNFTLTSINLNIGEGLLLEPADLITNAQITEFVKVILALLGEPFFFLGPNP